MCCLRHYLNVRMYADFDLHTEVTLSTAEAELTEKFHPALLVRHNYVYRCKKKMEACLL
jgi:hypothetical protein